MKYILFYGFNEEQCIQIKKYNGKIWNSQIIPDNKLEYSKSSLETWRTRKFAQEVKSTNISIATVNKIMEEFSPGLLLSCIRLEPRVDNTNVSDSILAIKLRTRILLSKFVDNSIELIVMRSSVQTSSGLLLAEIGRIKKIPLYYFDNVTPINSVQLCKFDNNIEKIVELKNKALNKDKDVMNDFILEDHVVECMSFLRKRIATENSFLIFFKTNQFIFKAISQLLKRSIKYFTKALLGLLKRKEFILISTGDYNKKQTGFKFFALLAISELKLIFIVIWYEYNAMIDWICRDKNQDKNSVLFLSNYDPERTTCPDSFGFNDPRLCVIESGINKQVYYKEHPTIFLRHENFLYRSGKWRSISFYKDLKNLTSQKVLFCPTFLNTEYVANLAEEVHTIASSFVTENRGLITKSKSINEVKIRCYTKNWYTKLNNILSYDKKGINIENGNYTFSQIQKEYLKGIYSQPNLDIKDNVLFMKEIIDLIAENIDNL
tara:strand:- start:2319 stop:3791 length:1473 start_codon:yes stop_codon:yes gene_type:complete